MRHEGGHGKGRAMQAHLFAGAGIALTLAIASGIGEARRRRRRSLDAVGWIPWQLVQMLAILATLILVSVALNLR